jgi:hypothetical protein
VITEDQFRQILVEEAAQQVAHAGPNPWDRALELLHFTTSPSAPDGGGGSSTIDDQATHVYAFYDSQLKTVTIVSHPNQVTEHEEEMAMLTLAHELVHALQDRELDLAKLLPGSAELQGSDEYLAFDAVVEGDARFYEYLFTEELRVMLGLPRRDATTMPDEELDYVYNHFDELGSPLFATQYLMYPLGAKYLATAYRSGGNAAVRHAYAKAPRRTVGYLVGVDGRTPPVGSGAVCPAAKAEVATTALTDGEDQFGAVAWYAFLRGWGVPHDLAFTTAQTWTGDSLRVQATADLGTTAVAWRVELSAPPAAEVARTLGASGQLEVQPGTNSIEVMASDSATPLRWATGCK